MAIISGVTEDDGELVIMNEADWSVEHTSNVSSGAYSVNVTDGKKLVIFRKTDGESVGYGDITAAESGWDWEDDFSTLNTVDWPTDANLQNFEVTDGWLNLHSLGWYGTLYSKDISGITGLDRSAFELECRCKRLGGGSTSYQTFGLRYDEVGFGWYLDGEDYDRRLYPTGGWWEGPNRGILPTHEPVVINMTQVNNIFSLKVEYEQEEYKQYNYDDSIAREVTGTGDGRLFFGSIRSGAQWHVDYIKIKAAE